MTERMPADARAVANLLLDRAEQRKMPVTNLALQKLLYFAHGLSLVRHRRPLMTGHFVAWRLGPVHPTVYDAFKAAGAEPIRFRATRRDLRLKVEVPLAEPDDLEVHDCVDEVLTSLGRKSASTLVQLSHAPGGPWDFVVNEGRTSERLGLRIPDTIIATRFHQKVTVGPELDAGDRLEDTPPA